MSITAERIELVCRRLERGRNSFHVEPGFLEARGKILKEEYVSAFRTYAALLAEAAREIE